MRDKDTKEKGKNPPFSVKKDRSGQNKTDRFLLAQK